MDFWSYFVILFFFVGCISLIRVCNPAWLVMVPSKPNLCKVEITA
jgi:hypothetical protein